MNFQAVFYADDDEDDLMLFEEAFSDIKVELSTSVSLHIVKNGIRLIETIIDRGESAPIILLDINMPFKSGIDYLDDIRTHRSLDKAIVIMYSTSSDENIIRKCYERGANYYVSKPNDYGTLKKTVKLILTKNWSQHTKNIVGFEHTDKTPS